MKIINCIYTLVFVTLISSCHNDDGCTLRIKGKLVRAWVDTNIPIDSLYRTINELAQSIKLIEVGPLNLRSEFPEDSLDFIINVIESKSYISDPTSSLFHQIGFSNHFLEIILNIVIIEFNNETLEDWNDTVEFLKLSYRTPGINNQFVFEVPEGDEQVLADTLETLLIIEHSYPDRICE